MRIFQNVNTTTIRMIFFEFDPHGNHSKPQSLKYMYQENQIGNKNYLTIFLIPNSFAILEIFAFMIRGAF